MAWRILTTHRRQTIRRLRERVRESPAPSAPPFPARARAHQRLRLSDAAALSNDAATSAPTASTTFGSRLSRDSSCDPSAEGPAFFLTRPEAPSRPPKPAAFGSRGASRPRRHRRPPARTGLSSPSRQAPLGVLHALPELLLAPQRVTRAAARPHAPWPSAEPLRRARRLHRRRRLSSATRARWLAASRADALLHRVRRAPPPRRRASV